MNKHINKTNILIVTFIMLLFTGCIAPVKAENEASGFTVLSITPSTPVSNNEDLKNANFTVVLIGGGGGSIVGDYGSETFSKFLTNMFVEYPLRIELDNAQETLDRQIFSDGRLYKHEYHYIDASDPINVAKCDGSDFCLPMHTDARMSVFNPDKILAVNRVQVGTYGSFGKANINQNVDMTVTINGVPHTENLGSGDISKGSINFYDTSEEWFAVAKFIGYIPTGQSPPEQTRYIATYKPENKQWQIAPKYYYDLYKESLIKIDSKFNNWKDSNYQKLSDDNKFKIYVCEDNLCANVVNCITEHNTILKTLTDSNVKIGYESILSTSTSITTDTKNNKITGNVKDTIDLKIGNVLIVMNIKASKLKPYIPVGIPKIESIISNPFNSGSGNNSVYITVTNVGKSKGTFSAYLKEESGTFTSLSNVESAKTTLEPKQTGTITMYIGHGANLEEIQKTGTIIVYDVNFPGENNTVSKDFTIKMESPLVCKPNEYRLFNDKVYKCNKEGTDEVLTLECEHGLLRQIDGKYSCEKVDGNTKPDPQEESESITSGSKDLIPEEDKKEESGALINALYWILCFLILTSIFMIANKIRNEEPKITKQNMDKSLTFAGIIVGILYICTQFIALSESLGITLWITILIITILTIIANVLAYVNIGKRLPIYISIGLAVFLFIITTSLLSGTKEIMCGSWTTSWIFSDCEKFSLTSYIFGK